MSEDNILDITPPSSPLLVVDRDSLFGTKQYAFGKITSFRWFTCIGDAKLGKLNLHENGYIKSDEISIFNENELSAQKSAQSKNIVLFDENLDFGSLFLFEKTWLFRKARSNILVLHEASKMKPSEFHLISEQHSTQDYLNARKELIRMFFALREYLCWMSLHNNAWALSGMVPGIEEELRKFRLFLGNLTVFPEYILHRGVSQQGHKCLEAPYHLFHCHLDVLWLHLTAVYQLDKIRRLLSSHLTDSQSSQLSDVSDSSNKTSLNHYALALVADLIDLALNRFEKFQADIRSLLVKSPFACNCVAELWVLLQQMMSKLHARGVMDNFWSFVNKAMDGLSASGAKLEQKQNSVKLLQTTTRSCSNSHAFSLWFLKHTAMLYSQDLSHNNSNYPLLESIMKSLLSTEVLEANMRVYLALLEKTVIKYWEPKSEIIIQLWEYFQKRLNNTFYVPGSNLDSMTIMSETVIGMVKQVKSRLSSQYQGEDSFNMFLRLIGLHLQRVTAQSQHWNQIRGRIYSKLSASKVQALTEMGLYHLASLFLTLAVTADLSEVNKKMQSLLGSVAQGEEDTSPRHLVWRTNLSFCLLMAERGLDFASALSPLTAVLDSQHITTPLVRTYIDGLRAILEASPSLKIDHNILIGSWVCKYLTECSQNDAGWLLETIVTISQRVQKQPEDQDKFQSSVWQYVCLYLRQHVGDDSSLPLADVALNLCLLSQGHCATLHEILNLFLNNPSTNISLVRRFLWLLVQKSELLLMPKNNSTSTDSIEVLIIKGWMRCSLLSLDYKSSELCRLTSCVAYLEFVSDICMDLPSAADPLLHFIVAVSNKFKTAKDIRERSSLRLKIGCLLNGTDKWVDAYMKHAKSPEVLTRIYHIIGLIFSLMPSLIYVKSRPNTVMKGLLDTMFLQVSAYKPSFEPSSIIKSAISSYLHLYIKGLADLAVMKDSYVERCVQDLVRIYLPWVVGQSRCVLHECVASADSTASLILSTVCAAFLRPRGSSPHPHPHCSQALKFLSAIVTSYSRELNIMLLLIETCFERVCDTVMFCEDHHRQKNEAKHFLSLIFECHCFGDQTSSKIMEKLKSLCQVHLSFSPGKLFALFHEVMEHRPEIIARFLPELQNQIRSAESKRGLEIDQSLRTYITKLDDALKSIRNGT